MITLIGDAPESDKYVKGQFEDFRLWLLEQRHYQLDTETTWTESWVNKDLITLQFGDLSNTRQWVLQWSVLSDAERAFIKQQLEREDTLKLIHNAMFEAIVFLSHGIWLEGVYDTMLCEQVLDMGQMDKPPSLVELAVKYLAKNPEDFDKSVRVTFGDNILTEEKVLYAAEDVMYLGAIMRMQIPELQRTDQDWVAALENEVVLSYAEMTYNGFDFDQEKWRENIALAQPVIDAAKVRLDGWLMQDPFHRVAASLGYVSDKDEVEIRWSAPNDRFRMLQLVYPEVPGGSLGVVKKFHKTLKAQQASDDDLILMEDYLRRDYGRLEQVLLNDHKDTLIKEEFLIPAGTIRINWNSPDQVIPLIKTIAPRVKGLNEKERAKISHPIIQDLEKYKENLKLTSTYGELFIEKHVDVDGKVRTSFNQLVSTGRVSSRKPNMQNIPVEGVGPRYRECFVAPPGWKVVGADMSSQELVIIATLSQDPVWLKSLRDGEDLHSTTSELLYGQRWKDAAEETCAYYHGGHVKCKCKEHEDMRYKVKRINYGLAYGMSEIKLAAELSITRDEALALMTRYFKTFPRIKRLLDQLGRFGVSNGYAMTMAPYFRRRAFPTWKFHKQYIMAHLNEVEYNHELGAIERASKNMPIQGSAGDQIKTASVAIRFFIKDNCLRDHIKPNLQIHDENVSIAREEIAEWWSIQNKRLMEEAAMISITSGLLKADAGVSDKWTK